MNNSFNLFQNVIVLTCHLHWPLPRLMLSPRRPIGLDHFFFFVRSEDDRGKSSLINVKRVAAPREYTTTLIVMKLVFEVPALKLLERMVTIISQSTDFLSM
mmetsp:Transcript_24016/g.47960  ORF Transcript_24016/g.47960 Transcript_24016/m.47960 type:complete len:101 (+) Transcript_24016:1281-1583(+)